MQKQSIAVLITENKKSNIIASYTPCGISASNDFDKRFDLIALLKQSIFLQIYVPLPLSFPVESKNISFSFVFIFNLSKTKTTKWNLNWKQNLKKLFQ